MILSEAITATGVEMLAHLDRQAELPLVDRSAAQGDVALLRVTTPGATTTLPAAGVVLVESEVTTHTHSLHAAPGSGVCFDRAPARRGDLTLGTLTVPDGAEALVVHQEHGGLRVAPGTYRIGRQREWAGEWRQVQD